MNQSFPDRRFCAPCFSAVATLCLLMLVLAAVPALALTTVHPGDDGGLLRRQGSMGLNEQPCQLQRRRQGFGRAVERDGCGRLWRRSPLVRCRARRARSVFTQPALYLPGRTCEASAA